MPPIRSLSGIRGLVGKTMDPCEAYKSTVAFYEQYLKKQKRGQATLSSASLKVVLGKDAKASGNELVFGIKKALEDISRKEEKNIEIVYLGVTSTPMLQWTVKNYRASGGINVTASHNDIRWNGIKLISRQGFLLDPERMEKINLFLENFSSLAQGSQFKSGKPSFLEGRAGKKTMPLCRKAGKIRKEYNEDVICKIKKRIDLCLGKKGEGEKVFEKIRRKGYKVALDACSGDSAEIPREFLISLGIKKENIIVVNSRSIENSQRRLEPSPEYLGSLKGAVRKNKADIGFALDPDQDRLAVMPLRSEEETLLLAGKFLLELQKQSGRKCIRKIVVNLSTSRAWEALGEEYGVQIMRTAVGEINVALAMKENGIPFGGEGNGGVILGEVNYGRNSTVGMCLILAYLAWSGKKLRTLERELPQFTLFKEKVKVSSRQESKERVETIAGKLAGHPNLLSVDKRDGYKFLFRDNSWLQLRSSNTEPTVRVFAEAELGKEEIIKKLLKKVKSSLERE